MHPSQTVLDLIETISQLSGPAAYCTIVGVLFICSLGVPIPEDITLLLAGLLASGHRISLSGALIAGFGGVLIGDAILFYLGRRFGKKFFKLPGLRRVFTPERIAAAEARIRLNGPFICFIARFLPGLRSPIFATAGALGVKRSTFFLLDGLAALLSVPLWVYLGYWVGDNFDEALVIAKQIQVYIFGSVSLLILSYIAYKLFRRRQMRIASARRAQFPQV
jgi:membrane protein DedA with SNARE-associated domain